MVTVEKSAEIALVLVVSSGVVDEVEEATACLSEEDVVDSAALELQAVMANVSAMRRLIAAKGNTELKSDELLATLGHPLPATLPVGFPLMPSYGASVKGLYREGNGLVTFAAFTSSYVRQARKHYLR